MYYAVNQAYKPVIQEISERNPTASNFFSYLLTYMDDSNEFVGTLDDIAFDLFGVKSKRKIKECVKYLNKAIQKLESNKLIFVEETYDDNLIFQVNKDVAIYVGFPFTMLEVEEENFVNHANDIDSLDDSQYSQKEQEEQEEQEDIEEDWEEF